MYESFKKIISESDNIVFFGGAGVSTESDIPDFRSEQGLYKTKNNFAYPPEIMLSHSFFMEHTEDFYDFYKTKMIYSTARPNLAHIALAKLESEGKLKAIITQNIDGLHQAAGSKNVLELHGSVQRNKCMKCGKSYDLDYVMSSQGFIPYCTDCNGIIKPEVVLYEEGLDSTVMAKAVKFLENADVLIIGGTSLVVYPAAGLIQYYPGNKLILINRDSTPYDKKANLVFHESIGKLLQLISN